MTNKQTIDGVPSEQVERALDAIEQVGLQDKFIDYTFVRTVKHELRALLDAPATDPELGSAPTDHMAWLLDKVVSPGDYPTHALHEQIRSTLEVIRKPFAQPQGRPVAEFGADCIFNLRKQPNGERWPVGTKLYVHADSGEVQRLRAEVAKWRGTAGRRLYERDTLRSQLAERDALLREVLPCLAMSTNGQATSYMRKIDETLSTSAKPKPRSEPVVRRSIGQVKICGLYYPAECRRCGWIGSSQEGTDEGECGQHLPDESGLCMGELDQLDDYRALEIIQTEFANPPAPVAVVLPDLWQPIETAPKDGTEIILRKGDRVTSGAWTEWSKSEAEFHGSTGAYLGQVEYDSGSLWASWDGGFCDDDHPTHWQPLPTVTPQQ